jgi:hypothetical protein
VTCAERGLLGFAAVLVGAEFTGAPRTRFAAFAGRAGVRARELFFVAVFDIDALPVRAPIFFFAARCTLPGAIFFPTFPAITLSTVANRKVFVCQSCVEPSTQRQGLFSAPESSDNSLRVCKSIVLNSRIDQPICNVDLRPQGKLHAASLARYR